jgi:ectoine hydroxylase-related dioxygenase (phytanoyl-CoA dioxygenase family)
MIGFEVSDGQISDFHRDGFIIVRNLFDTAEMAGLLDYAKGDRALANESYVRRDATGAETRLALRNDLDDASVYTAIVRSQRVAGTMQGLLGDEVYHYHHKMMLKEPRIGGAWEWHQDYGYWYNFGCLFPDMGSCMIAVDQATRVNGCLQVIRGSHTIGRIDHVKIGEQVGADPVRVEAALARLDLVYCEMGPGDALFFHSNLLHRSDQNTSDQPRWSLICCYNTRHNDPFITRGRHPNYSPLEIWPDQRVLETIVGQASRLS